MALCGELAFGLFYSILSPGEGARWHYVENRHLGYSIQSPHQERVFSGIVWRIGILVILFNLLIMRGCSVALCGEWAFWLIFSIPPTGKGAQWHYVRMGILGYTFQTHHHDGLLSSIMWRMGILGYTFQSPHYEGVLIGSM